MKINAALIVQLRLANSWSQDELAIASGLSVRTVQRIETLGVASLQSRKALAALFELDNQDLNVVEQSLMKQYEYKTLEIDNQEGFFAGLKSATPIDFTAIFNPQGAQGWRVVQILTPDIATAVYAGKTGKLIALLEREVE